MKSSLEPSPQSGSEPEYVQQPATVVALQDGWVTLSTIRLNTCQQCSMKAGCGQRMLNQASCDRSQIELPQPPDMPLNLGQEVQVAIPQGTFIRASLWVFLWPLLTMLIAAGLGQWLFASEAWIAISGLLGLLLGLLIMRRQVKIQERQSNWQPKIFPLPATPEQHEQIIKLS